MKGYSAAIDAALDGRAGLEGGVMGAQTTFLPSEGCSAQTWLVTTRAGAVVRIWAESASRAAYKARRSGLTVRDVSPATPGLFDAPAGR